MQHNPIRICYQALYRPSLFATYLAASSKNRFVVLATGGIVISLLLLLIGYILPRLAPVRWEDLAYSILYPPFIAIIVLAMAIQGTTPLALRGLSMGGRIMFWFLATQLHITPLLALSWAILGTFAYSRNGFLTDIEIFLLLSVLGLALGSVLNLRLVLSMPRSAITHWRWGIVSSFALIGLILWFAPVVRGTEWLLLVPFFYGIVFAQLRLGNWVIQTAWTWSYLLEDHRNRHVVSRLLHRCAIHDDELRLLPLAGLNYLLWQTSSQDVEAAYDWLLQRSQHPADSWMVERFLRQAATSKFAHNLFFRLSCDQQGQALLHQAAAPHHAPRLLKVYASLSSVSEPGAWRTILPDAIVVLQAAHVTQYHSFVDALVVTTQAILEARSWHEAQKQVAVLPAWNLPLADPHIRALFSLRQHISTSSPTPRLDAGRSVMQQLQGNSQEWPTRLLWATAEHVDYLSLQQS